MWQFVLCHSDIKSMFFFNGFHNFLWAVLILLTFIDQRKTMIYKETAIINSLFHEKTGLHWGNHYITTSHLKWKLVCQEGAHKIASVTSQPQQQEPNREGTVHISRFAWTVVLSEITKIYTELYMVLSKSICFKRHQQHLRKWRHHEAEDGQEA